MTEIQHLTKRLQCTCVGERADHHVQCPVRIGAEIATVVKSLISAGSTRTRDVAWMLVYDFEMIDCRCDEITLTAGTKANLERRIASALSSKDTELAMLKTEISEHRCLPTRVLANARADLARKVIKTLTEIQIHDQYNNHRKWGFNYGKEKFLAALGELFTEEGVPDRDNRQS